MNIVHIFSDGNSEYNSSRHRGQTILDALHRAGHKVSYIHVDAWMKDSRKSELADAEIIVIERVLVEESVERTKFWQQRGKSVVVDIDDAYHLLQPFEESGNQAAKFWQQGIVDITYPGGVKVQKQLETTPLAQFRNGLKYCAGITMPSRILAEDWSIYAKCWFVPNYLNEREYLPFAQKQLPHRDDEIVIGWGGSMSHKISFEKSGCAEALRSVLSKRPQAKVMICGDQRILDIIKCPPQQVLYRHYVTWNEWPRVLASFDIGIAPLHGRYDHSRSSLKLSETATMGIPVLATGCPTYSEWQENGTGWYVEDGPESEVGLRAEQWESRLLDMIDNYDQYKRATDEKLTYAMEWWIDRRVNDIVNTYQEIIDSAR